jgi:hypothetical protein
MRERRETIGQQVDQGVLDARKKGSELSEFFLINFDGENSKNRGCSGRENPRNWRENPRAPRDPWPTSGSRCFGCPKERQRIELVIKEIKETLRKF